MTIKKNIITKQLMRQVKQLWDQGLGSRTIAIELDISRDFVQEIYKTLGLYNIDRRMSTKKLLKTYGKQFKTLYLSGIPTTECAKILNISYWQGFKLKELLDLHQEHWDRMGMPPKFSQYTRSLIFGTLMGDASVHPSGGNKYDVLSLCHSPKQAKYIQHKKKLLTELSLYNITEMSDGWGSLRCVSPPHPELKQIRGLFYPKGTKQISMRILKELTPHAIALWFMDDGSLSSKGGGFSIATCSFDDISHKNIIKYFKKQWNITFITRTYDYPRLYCYGANALLFKKLIEQYIIPSMRYKIKLNKGVGTGIKQWTQSETNYLINHFKPYGKNLLDIAKHLQRSKNAIIQRIQKLKKEKLI